MSQNRPYIDLLLEALGLEPKQEETRSLADCITISKCLNCCWGSLTGDTIFCPFVGCMKRDPVFVSAFYGGKRDDK